MKSTYLRIVLFVLSFAMLLSFAACGEAPDNETTASTTEANTASAETSVEEVTTAQPTEVETTLKIETSEATEEETTEVQTTEKVTETESETLTETETVTETVTETFTETFTETVTETDTDAETEETFPETNLILGEDVEYASDFTVSNVFDSDMVIQRNEFVRVWGWAPESENGKKVSATFMGYQADALIENGEWEIVFYQRHEANASLGNDLVVYAGSIVSGADAIADDIIETDTETAPATDTETEAEGDTDKSAVYVFEDVLIGDVFMVIGQSNVQYSISGYLTAEPDLKWTKDMLSEDTVIRFNYNSNTQRNGYPQKGTTEVCKDAINDYGWVKPDSGNIDELSAIGYFIAHQITELTKNGIPVGISQFSASGRPLSVFMPNHLADLMETDHFDENLGIYVGNVHTSAETRYMYNQYLYPFERMPIAGIVWYQGEAESNINLSSVYVERFTALMEYMRSTHNIYNKEFPVFYVEFPSVYYVEGSGQYLETGRIRACTGMIPLSLSNSYIAVCSDLWNNETNDNNIHPYCKYEQAERVTDLMQAVIYGTKTMDEATGPILKSYEISDDRKTIILKFSNFGEGLTTSDGGKIVNGFTYIKSNNAAVDKTEVNAEITAPDTITITFSKAAYGVAYNHIEENFYGEDINLCNSYGNPAGAFWIFIPKE